MTVQSVAVKKPSIFLSGEPLQNFCRIERSCQRVVRRLATNSASVCQLYDPTLRIVSLSGNVTG